ncbi:fimbrial protein [Enterobacter sp. ENT03]|uniref:fimbrial protein n=1 Tax=Enterobacter sp. ENT03 TaxID=2854780 RepID=UPI001C46E17B|nr:fimbrial protein [Enterobacter sp. ENT03]MBV7403498.1 type 1 fimbrial protein [Enterobacter sp. ENT03]
MKYVLCAFWLWLPFGSQAVVEDHIEIRVTGRITDSICEVEPKVEPVAMGTQVAQNFHDVGNASDPINFTIQLKNCGQDAKEVRIAFTGTSASDASLLALNSGSVSQLAIRILDNNKNPIALNDRQDGGRIYTLNPLIPTQNLQFYAQYVALSVPVDAGEADATANFSLTWP